MAQRGSYAKGVAKREEILTTALEVIAREGYRGASVKELADAVGLSQAGLLHYFGTKDELFTEILRKRDDQDRTRYSAHPDADPLRVFLDVMRHNAEVPGLVELYSRLSVEAADPAHPAHRFFAERSKNLHAMFAGARKSAHDEGRVPAWAATEQFGLVLTALADGLQTKWLQDPRIDMAGEIERLLVALGVLEEETVTP